ncbi:MAG: TonB-dependent receptor, partial [Bacteroidetes bacterium]|nr:TonB-dependent receptor [Bacteroidota bacterium]
DPFFFSMDYVYGSGFPDYLYDRSPTSNSSQLPTNYSRLDMAAVYKFLNRRLQGEVGVSVLNVLNRENFKPENFERIPAGQTSSINLYAEAIPFTPTLFLKLYL